MVAVKRFLEYKLEDKKCHFKLFYINIHWFLANIQIAVKIIIIINILNQKLQILLPN